MLVFNLLGVVAVVWLADENWPPSSIKSFKMKIHEYKESIIYRMWGFNTDLDRHRENVIQNHSVITQAKSIKLSVDKAKG